mgnify:CR=1 FL=1
MKIHQYREMMRYLTRKPLSDREVELVYNSTQQPLAASSEELGTREGFKLGTRGPIARILGKEIVTSENEYAKLKQFIIDTYSVNKDDANLFPAIEKYSEKFGGNLSNTAESLGINRKAIAIAAEKRGFKIEGKGKSGTTKIKDLDYGDLTASEFTNLIKRKSKII